MEGCSGTRDHLWGGLTGLWSPARVCSAASCQRAEPGTFTRESVFWSRPKKPGGLLMLWREGYTEPANGKDAGWPGGCRGPARDAGAEGSQGVKPPPQSLWTPQRPQPLLGLLRVASVCKRLGVPADSLQCRKRAQRRRVVEVGGFGSRCRRRHGAASRTRGA